MVPQPTLEAIDRNQAIRVCFQPGSTDYYVYRGVTKGFQYELLRLFADELEVGIIPVAAHTKEKAWQPLFDEEADLLAIGLPALSLTEKGVLFSEPLFYSPLVLVQHIPESFPDSLPQPLCDTIYLPAGNGLEEHIRQLRDSLALSLEIVTLEERTMEDLLLATETGEIPLTVAWQHVADIASQYMPHIRTSLVITEPQPICWAVDTHSTDLLERLNRWIREIRGSEVFNVLYNRYYRSNFYTTLENSKYYKLKRGIISPFDSLIREGALRLGWDWRLLAAMIYHESGFDPESVSHRGAVGLMQVMPETSLEVGGKDLTDPWENIRSGVSYLLYLEGLFPEKEFAPEERICFILASYNVGAGHVMDAMRLAEAFGRDPRRWNCHCADFLLLKSFPAYYNHPQVRNGYCNGRETFCFVRNILETFSHYQNNIQL